MKNTRLQSTIFATVVACFGCGKEVTRFGANHFSTDPPPPAPFFGKLVTTNNGDDTLSVVNPASPDRIERVPVGFIPVELEGPHHISADPRGQSVFVNLSEAVAGSGSGPHGSHGGGTTPGFVLKLNSRDGSLAAFVQVDPNPGDNVLSPDGHTLFVTHYDLIKWQRGAEAGNFRLGDSNLAIIDADTLRVTQSVPLCPAAHGVRLSADAKALFASCGPDEIAILRLDAPTLQARRVTLPGTVEGSNCTQCPYAVGIAPDQKVWVSNLGPNSGRTGSGGISIYNPATDGFSQSFSFCGRAVFAAFTAATAGGFDALVPEQGPCGDSIHFFHVSPSGAIAERSPLQLEMRNCLNAHMITLSSDNRTGYLICEGDHVAPGTIVFFDLAVPSVTASFPLGVFPDGIAMVPQP